MKKIIAAFLLSLFFLFLLPSAFADSTALTTTVPSEHTISLDVGTGGMVNSVRGKVEIRVDRASRVVFQIAPDSGFETSSVVYNGKDVTAQVREGSFVIESLTGDGSLTVRFQRLSAGDLQTGDSPKLLLWAMLLMMSAVSLTAVKVIGSRTGNKSI